MRPGDDFACKIAARPAQQTSKAQNALSFVIKFITSKFNSFPITVRRPEILHVYILTYDKKKANIFSEKMFDYLLTNRIYVRII